MRSSVSTKVGRGQHGAQPAQARPCSSSLREGGSTEQAGARTLAAVFRAVRSLRAQQGARSVQVARMRTASAIIRPSDWS